MSTISTGLNDWIDDAEAQAALADPPSNSVEPKVE
jgi:hypothetical protein